MSQRFCHNVPMSVVHTTIHGQLTSASPTSFWCHPSRSQHASVHVRQLQGRAEQRRANCYHHRQCYLRKLGLHNEPRSVK